MTIALYSDILVTIARVLLSLFVISLSVIEFQVDLFLIILVFLITDDPDASATEKIYKINQGMLQFTGLVRYGNSARVNGIR